MLKDHFQKANNALNNLRSQHFKVSEYLSKGKYKMKQKFFGKGKKHYDFDLNSQQFFHEYVDDVIFQQPQIQQLFYNEISKCFEYPISFSNKIKVKDECITQRKNPSEVRAILARHFSNRISDLKYKKYLTLLRAHNLDQQQHLTAIKSRTNLIQRQIQQCINRETRLEVQDYFETSYTQGGKPVPVNQNGHPIYKYLDEEECWFSNINREDIQVYLRNILFKQGVLKDAYWAYWHQFQYVVFTYGLTICKQAEQQLYELKSKNKDKAIKSAKQMIAILQKGLETLSPGNLQQKQYLNNFIYKITGITNQRPVITPLYSATFLQLCQNYNKIVEVFFKQVTINNHRQIIEAIPKFNSFCSIMFKYQNQQILQGQKQIKLGLEDDVNIKKQLVTMLEEQWVNEHIIIDYKRFDYKMHFKPIDWTLDTFSARLEKQIRKKNQNGYAQDSSLQQLILLIRMTNYSDFRRIMRKRSQKIIERLEQKYEDMELIQKYSIKSDEEINMQKLSSLYKLKQTDQIELFNATMLKQSTKKFFKTIIKDHIISNPVEIEMVKSLICIKIRQMRTKMLNIFNAIRCYQRNIDMDLRVIDGCQFKFQIDDDFLINSNKQTVEKFEKNIKETQTMISRTTKPGGNLPVIQSEAFLIKGSIQKPMLYKKDKVEKHYYNQKIPHILVVDGKKKKNIFYDIALEDMKLAQDRILEVGTNFINKYERLLKMKDMNQIVDRISLLSELFELELQSLYQKFNLIQSYYYIYQNTTQPLNAHKVAKNIISIIYEQPKIDFTAQYFANSYMFIIQRTKTQNETVKLFTKNLQKEQFEKNRIFHKKFANMCQIPLTLWAYVYRDIQLKGSKNFNKMQRMNSVSSKMSRNDKDERNLINDLRQQIRQQFDEDSQQQEFNIQTYDQYMLRRNMDDIFEDIVGGVQHVKQPKQKDGNSLGSSVLGLQNLTVNPKFEGGPHALHNYLPEVNVTSCEKQKLLNFSQQICWVSNIHKLILKLSKQAKTRYGFCNLQYQLCLAKYICKKLYQILLSSPVNLEPMHIFETDDIYHETVTRDCRLFEQTMQPILDLPTIIQLSIQSTHDKHQSSLPSFEALQHFDISILANLVKLQKPLNSAVYRELNLGINLIEFLRIKQKMWHIQLEREQLINSYRVLGSFCGVVIQKYSECYAKSGQSEVFSASSEIKCYSDSYLKKPTFNQSIQQLRTYYELQQAQLKVLKTQLQIYKQNLQDYIRIEWDIARQNVNTILNRNNILISLDKKNVKMIASRVKGYIGTNAIQLLKNKSYLKHKLKLRNTFQQKLKQLQQTNVEQIVMEIFLNNDSKKYGKHCLTILSQKVRKLLIFEYIKSYANDLKHYYTNNKTYSQLIESIGVIRNYCQSLPYLSKLFIIPTEYQNLNKKVFYDQKKLKIVQQQSNVLQNVYYIQSKQQAMQDWQTLFHVICPHFLQKEIDISSFIKSTFPPNSREMIFKWMFKIPANNVGQKQKQSMRHMLKVFEPYSGKISISEYRYRIVQEGTRNKIYELYKNYSTLIEYIESNLMIISLQVDDDVIDSLFSIIDHKCNFEETYPLKDEAAIYETDPQGNDSNKEAKYLGDSIMAPCFIYENRKDQLEKRLKVKISSRGYTENKMHWAVVDEILDFIISKVQGYGVIRHCTLELKDQISMFSKLSVDSSFSYMRSKTQNIYYILWLALWDTFDTYQTDVASDYVPIFLDTFVKIPKLQQFQAPNNLNARRGISDLIENNWDEYQQQKNKFNKGIYQFKNDFMVSKLKIPFNFLPIHVADAIQEQIYKSELSQQQKKQQTNIYIQKYNADNIVNFRQILKLPGKQFRFKLFAKVRERFQQGRSFVQSKIISSDNFRMMEAQQKKIVLYQYLAIAKINLIALTVFKLSKFSASFPDSPQNFWKAYHEMLGVNKQLIDINAFNIYDMLEAYQEGGKIAFTKIEMNIIGNNKSQKNDEKNRLVRMIIFSKLASEQFKSQLIQAATKLLAAEKLPKLEQKKIQNLSLIPRVHLISAYSSPLITERKTYISQQFKLAFVQAFINRFRNKVSRVDLLSAGYGFVITVPDLEDCVNFMNKLLFTFNEKQFKVRLQSFSQYFQILVQGIRTRNIKIAEQKAIIKLLQDKVNNTLQAEYLSKVSKMLQQKLIIQQKLRLAQQSSNGLQHRVRKAVQNQYDLRITSLQKQNQQLKLKFNQFKDILVKLTKDATKNNFLTLVNNLRKQVSGTLDKKIDLSESFRQIQEMNVRNISQTIKIKQQQSKIFTKQSHANFQEADEDVYNQQNIQKCKIGQDIIHDPYYVTKLINKMRIFNLFKLGSKRIKQQANDQKKIIQLTSLHQIQDRVIAQTQRQVILRDELIKAQSELSKKSVELQKAKHEVEALENEKAKLKILLVTKEKKIQQKQRENEQFKKKLQEKAEVTKSQNKISGDPFKQDDLPRLSNIRQQKRSRRTIQKQIYLTGIQEKSNAMSMYQKFQLSNKDSTWREKCQQLYLQNKKLQSQLDKIKEGLSGVITPNVREGMSLNMRNKPSLESSQRETSRTQKKKFPNISFKYGALKGAG